MEPESAQSVQKTKIYMMFFLGQKFSDKLRLDILKYIIN